MNEPHWFDELVAEDVTDLVRESDFDPTELADIRRWLNAHPWRELVISAHRTANAAKVVRRRRRNSARWSNTPGLGLRTRKLGIEDWTVVTVVWVPATGPTRNGSHGIPPFPAVPRDVSTERHEALA